jgi:WD40 repeat protein
VHFWYPESGDRDDHQPLPGHEKRVSALAMPADGSYVLTASFDGTARVWPMQPQLLIRRACATVGRSPSEDEWKGWFPARKYEAICG